jgi:hypothetical protein
MTSMINLANVEDDLDELENNVDVVEEEFDYLEDNVDVIEDNVDVIEDNVDVIEDNLDVVGDANRRKSLDLTARNRIVTANAVAGRGRAHSAARGARSRSCDERDRRFRCRRGGASGTIFEPRCSLRQRDQVKVELRCATDDFDDRVVHVCANAAGQQQAIQVFRTMIPKSTSKGPTTLRVACPT